MTLQMQHASGRLLSAPEVKLIADDITRVEADGTFSGYASLFGIEDLSHDIVEKGAFLASLSRRGPSGVKMLYQHDPAEPIGRWTDIRETTKGLARHRPADDQCVARPRGPPHDARRHLGWSFNRLPHGEGAQGSQIRHPAASRGRSLGDLDRDLPDAAGCPRCPCEITRCRIGRIGARGPRNGARQTHRPTSGAHTCFRLSDYTAF